MPKITEMWAYIIEDDGPDDEGVTAFQPVGGDAWMPMVGADEARMKSLRPMAKRLATLHGKPIKLVRFSVREEVETIR